MTTTFKGRWNVSGSNDRFIKIRTKLSSVLMLCLVRFFYETDFTTYSKWLYVLVSSAIKT